MFSRLKLGTKFSLLLVIIFLVGSVVSGLILYRALDRRAQEEVTTRGLLMLETMNSVRIYTSEHINPMLQDELAQEDEFISESVPAYSAREVFENFRTNEGHEDFFYKEATLNPTNPRDQADSFETDLVEQFRADSDLEELTGYRTIDDTRMFYIARPLSVSRESCLACHSTPDAAPASLINTYGTEGGFGWELNEIIAAQIVYVPADEVFENARLSFILVMVIFAAVFGVVIVALNLVMRPLVVRPIRNLATLADKVGNETLQESDLETTQLNRVTGRDDELGQLGRVFRRMVQEVYKREQNLKRQLQELRIEIDLTKRTEQVSAITETEYFQQLQERAKDLRRRPSTSDSDNDT